MIKKIHQILPNFSNRDAVGTDTFLMREALRSFGFESDIFYEVSGDHEHAQPLEKLTRHLNREDTALIFHFSIGTAFPGRFVQYSNKKIVRYHNITPPEFFCAPAEGHIRSVCALGRQQIRMLSVFCDLVIADSAYNAREFTMCSPIPATIVPVFRDYDKLVSMPDDANIERTIRESGKPVVLFVGRICPNKAQHDLLKLVALYKKAFSTPFSLVLVGGFFSTAFQLEIEDYAKYLDLSLTYDIDQMGKNDVVIAGSISDEQLATFYRNSAVFCSLSDHEGFGVPLVEAMSFGLPILAHRAAAVPETVGMGGCLIDKNDWTSTVASLRAIISDHDFRQKLSEEGWSRSKQLSQDASRATLKTVFADRSIYG